jgi:hypothetical protein
VAAEGHSERRRHGLPSRAVSAPTPPRRCGTGHGWLPISMLRASAMRSSTSSALRPPLPQFPAYDGFCLTRRLSRDLKGRLASSGIRLDPGVLAS